jgi:hypothetical protein
MTSSLPSVCLSVHVHLPVQLSFHVRLPSHQGSACHGRSCSMKLLESIEIAYHAQFTPYRPLYYPFLCYASGRMSEAKMMV